MVTSTICVAILTKNKLEIVTLNNVKLHYIYRLEQIKRWQVVQLRQQSRDFSLILAIETTIEKKQKDNKSPEEKSSKILSSAGETRRISSSRWTFLTRNRVSRVNNVLQNYLVERTKS